MQNSEASSTAPAPIAAIDRALSVLTTLAESGPDGISLTELSQALASNKSTIYRVLHTMKLRGFAVQHSNIDRALSVLTTLAESGPDGISLTELSQALASNKSTIYRVLHTMKLRGFAVQHSNIDRALSVLTTLAESGPDGISLTELSQALASNKSTIYRVLHTMKLRGFAVQHSNNGNYSLGAAALSLHHHFPQDAMLRRDLQPVLAALSGSAHELIHLGTLSGDRVRYLDKIEPDRAIAVRSRIGLTTYAYTTALGRSILAGRAIEPASLGAYLPDFVEHRRSALDHFTREVERAKHVGWSREIEENEPDVACIGIPITLPDGDIVALSITAPAARMTPEHMAKVSATAFRTVDQYLPDGYTRVIPT